MIPQHKYCSWSKDGYEVISKEVKKTVKTKERENHVCINFVDKKHAVVIYGLNAASISSTEIYLRNCVESKLEIELPIQVTRYESLFIRNKHNVSLKEFCHVRFPAASDFKEDSAHLILKGTKAKVESARQRINEAINNLKVQEINFRHDSYGEMWRRKWFEVKKQQENAHNVLVNVYMVLDKKDANCKTPVDIGGKAELAIIGRDGDVVSKIEAFIRDIGTTLSQKTETATKGQLKKVLDGLKSKKLKLREDHNTEVVLDWEKLTFTLVAPNGSMEDLNNAHNCLMAYIQDVLIYKKTILTNNSGLAVLIADKNRWQQMVAIAKQHSVTIKLVSNGIDVRGKHDDITKARESIKDKLQEFLVLIAKQKVTVNNFVLPIFNTPLFEKVALKLKQECGVIVSYTKCPTFYGIKVKTPYDCWCTIDICIGNILNETCDAIVNVTDCNLQHTEGLAKEMINAGGSIIQNQCNEYVKSHGALNQCDAIHLDAGDLKCGKIIHCIPPLWVDGKHGEANDIAKTVSNCLSCAEECLTGTLLMPSFSCSLPSISEYAKASLKAVLDKCGDASIKYLSTVRFIMPTLEIAEEFKKQLQMLQSNCMFTKVVGSSDTAMIQRFNWFWQNDKGCFEPYDANTSALLSQQFLSSSTYKMTIKGNNYTVDFSKMIQINDETQKSRCMQRRPLEKKAQAVWKYENDQGQMDFYTEEQSQAIETMWRSKTPSEIQIGPWIYTFNFDSTPMKQINKTTNRKRSICRVSCEADNTTPSVEVDDQVEVVLLGSKQGLDKAEREINKFFKNNIISEGIQLSAPLSSDVVDSVCKKHKVEMAKLLSNKVVIKGLESNVTKAALEIKDILLQDYSKAESYPDEWEPQTEEPLELKPLTRNSPEWSKVSQNFLATLQSANITKIERVQNKWLWEKYSQHSERMKRKNKGVTNEKELFHGTSGTPPSCIYQDEEGFDMRYSNAGMWGNGNYFAVNSRYSHSYAHSSSDGTRQMFLAKVLTGHSVRHNPDRSLRMPPVRQHSTKGDMRYDTVTGETGGSQVFITYSNDKAYPFYLISYK